MLRGLGGDLRLALRGMRAAPIVTLAAIVSLAVGIGATTTAFSIGSGLMLRPLPVEDPQRLVTISSDTALRFGFQAGAGWSYAMWDRLRRQGAPFDGAFAWTLQPFDLSDSGEMHPVRVLIASGEFFRTLGVGAAAGRAFTAADDVRGGGPDGAVAVIGHDFWQRRFGGAASAIGSRVMIRGVPLTVIGAAPEGFYGVDIGQPFDIAIPFGVEPMIEGRKTLLDADRRLTLTVMLRLKAGQTIPQATAILRTLQPSIVGPGAPAFLQEPFTIVPASTGISDRSRLRQQYTQPLVALTILSALVLLIVCVNLANLLLARALARRRELSVRLALGAPRQRLARQVLVEALVPGIAGGLLGVMFATWTSRALVSGLPAAAGPFVLAMPVDWRVLAFASSLTIAVVALFAIGPALQAARVPPAAVLRDQAPASPRRGVSGPAGALILVQVALSIVLVAAAGLFARTLRQLANEPLGFNPKGLLVMTVDGGRFADAVREHDRIVEALGAVPGVTHAGGSIWTPVGTGGGGLFIDARGRSADSTRVAYNFVTPGWFETYGIPIRGGRDFERRDGATAPRVAIVNESLQRRLTAAAIGGKTGAGPCGDGCTVIGVVADTVYGRSLRDGAPPTVYRPLAQSDGLRMPDAALRVTLRTTGDGARLVPALSAALRRINPDLGFKLRPIERDLSEALAQERLTASLAAFFGAVALLLSAIGVYGVASHAVTRRRGEIAIRLALGGSPRAVVRTILARLSLCVLAGAGLGILAALWLSRFVAALLYGIAPHDTLTLAASVLLLITLAALAGWLPARRAARTDPARVLRES